MTPLHGIACFYDVGFGARAVSRKTPIYFMKLFRKLDFLDALAFLVFMLAVSNRTILFGQWVTEGVR